MAVGFEPHSAAAGEVAAGGHGRRDVPKQGEGCESASTKMSQSPTAAAAPVLRARPI
jgi:hypothetical protein